MFAKIKVIQLGQAFACFAIVTVRGKRVHETREVPHGMRNVAYGAARAWADANGYKVN